MAVVFSLRRLLIISCNLRAGIEIQSCGLQEEELNRYAVETKAGVKTFF